MDEKWWASAFCCHMGEPPKHYAKWKNPDTRGHFPQESVYMKYPERAHLQRQIRWEDAWACRSYWGLTADGYTDPFVALAVFHDCTVVVVVAPLCEVPKRHCTGCIEWVWFVVCNYTSVKQFRKVMQMPRRDMWEKMCHCFCNNEECPCSFHVLGPASSTCARCSLQKQSLCTSGPQGHPP